MKEVVVTTSWDDGHKLDVRLAELLKKYNIKGTFYVSPRDREFARSELLTDGEVKKLSKLFEIGAHTMTHPRLPKVSDSVARQEIVDSKKYLEKLVGKKIASFCYPGGNYSARHVSMVRDAGFTYARTVRRHAFGFKGFPFEADTTVNAYNHYQDLWKIAKFAKFNPVRTLRYFQWDNLAKAMFDYTLAHGGVYHLWGHSWEVDGHEDWEKLESVLKYISGKKGVRYVTNSELPSYRPKKLLVAAPYFPPHGGGVEFYSYHVADELQRQHGWQVCIVTSHERGNKVQKSSYRGLCVYKFPYWFKVSNSPLHPMWYFWLKRIIRDENIQIVNTQSPVPGLGDIAALSANRQHVPVIATYHMPGLAAGRLVLDQVAHVYDSMVLPLVLRLADAVICASDAVCNKALEKFRGKSFVITPGVDVEAFKPAKQLAGHVILFNGSLGKTAQHKGIHQLLQAMPAVVRAVPDTRLLVVGQGLSVSAFKKLTDARGVTKSVTFYGAQFDTALQDIYRQAAIFTLPSLIDNFPLVILEGMATGLPVVASRVGAVPDMIDDGRTGYVITPGNISELSEKLIYLLQHPEVGRRLGKRGRKKVEQSFSWDLIADKTDRVLREQLGMVEGHESA